jgi:regulator of PEP synthase PpsR (kinase-PPPase family)
MQGLFAAEQVSFFDASTMSIEEIASQLVQLARIERRI